MDTPALDFPTLNLSYWILQTIAMLVTAFLIPRLTISGPLAALAAVVALAFVNAQVWDAALFFHIPDSFGLQALLLFLSNGVIFWLLVKILPGLEVEGFLPALIAPVVFTICSLVISKYAKDVDWLAVADRGIELIRAVRDHFQGGEVKDNEPQSLLDRSRQLVASIVYLSRLFFFAIH